MKRLALILGLAGTLALPLNGATTSTVYFYLKTCAGQPQNRALTIEALIDPDEDGSNIFWGWGAGNTFYPTNGVAAVELEPNDYQVTMASTPGVMSITVPTNGMTYNAVDLATDLSWYRSASNGPATVVFPLLTMTGGAQTKSLRLAPLRSPDRNGTNIVWGPALSCYPTNGLATAHMEPNGYQVTMNGWKGALTIYVPIDGGTYNAASLPSTMPTNSAPELAPPPPPLLDFAVGQLTQTTTGTGNTGGEIRLYCTEEGNQWTMTNVFATPFAWGPVLVSSNIHAFTGYATEVGNGTNYDGESDPSEIVMWGAP